MTDGRSSNSNEEGTGAAGEETASQSGIATEKIDPDLRRRVGEEFDFDDFGPKDMARMNIEEWEAAFDPDSWITGEALLDRVEAELKYRVSIRDVFAVVERLDDGEPRILAYSDEGYAIVYLDGSVEGEGTVVRDVTPTVALCSMEEYDPHEMPAEGTQLPMPTEVPEGSGSLGNRMLQVIAAMLVISGIVMIGSSFTGTSNAPAITFVVGVMFLGSSLVLLLIVINARLADRFRANAYRNRLRSTGVESGERPNFVPVGHTEANGSTKPSIDHNDGEVTTDVQNHER